MNTLAKTLIAAALAVGIAGPAAAQEQQEQATLQVDRGTVMTSDGDSFVTANSGASIKPGQRLMVTEASEATVVYANQCTRKYNTPGVYVIEDQDHCRETVVKPGGVQNSDVATVVAVSMVIAPIIDSLTSSR